ncbi:MAG: chaperone modulator CbpM [Pseudomonadales bacterium]
MTEHDVHTISGRIFDESTEITIIELCEVCSIEAKLIEEMIDEGILESIGGHSEQRRFAYSCVRRTRTAIHLQRDLGLNLAGAALALELLDRIEDLRAQLRGR